MKRISNRNRMLILAFILAAATGVALHMAGHGGCRDSIRCAAVLHTVAALVFAAAAVRHATVRRNWYRKLFTGAPGRKSIATCALTAAFLLATATGIAAFFADKPLAAAGLCHYKAGILLCACCAVHMVRRLRRTPRK